MRWIRSACVLVLLASVCVATAHATEAPDRARFKPDVPEFDGDTFTFVVMGDPQPRDTSKPTETPAEFFETIAEVNERTPAFSVICGDLIMGYVGETGPIEQMWDSFLDAITKFDAPVFCVIGNHDVWQRPSEGYFLKRFGDVRWYSFDYGPTHFIVLDSEVVGEMNRIGPKQLEWLEADLEASRDQRFKFVFMHKPYQHFGAQWTDEIHPLLAKYGTTAVFAGHWHSHRKERTLDGITYYVLSAAGGIGNDDELCGGFRSFMEVTVAGDEVSYAVNRGGEILPDDTVTAAQAEAVETIRRGALVTGAEMPPVNVSTGMKGTGRVELTNATPYRIEYALTLELPDEAEAEAVDESSGVLAPDERAVHEFRVTCPALGETRPFPPVVVKADYTVAFKYVAGRLESRTAVAPAFTMPDELPAASPVDRAVKLDGRSTAVRIPFDEAMNAAGPFTVEAWLECESSSYVGGAISHEERSGFGLFLGEEGGLYTKAEGTPKLRFVMYDAQTKRPVEAAADSDVLPRGRWVHVACTSDGTTMAVWLDGKKIAEAAAPRAILPNEHPMYVGADLGWTGEPWAFVKGEIDEFRFSSVCRYTEAFTPAKRFEPDEDTLILYHLDRVLVDRVVDYSGHGHHGRLLGEAVLVER